jgi:hypothetical protein
MTIEMMIGGAEVTTTYRRYDPRLKNLVAKSGNIDRFKQYP